MPTSDSDSEEANLSHSREPRADISSSSEKDSSKITITKTEVLRAAFRFRGPLPPPEMLRAYEEVFPGCADRIVAMAERQSSHRQAIERSRIEATNKTEHRGQMFAFGIALAAIVGGVWLIAIGKDAGGLTTIIAAVGALVGAFLYGKRAQSKELQAKRQPLLEREEPSKQLELF